MEEYKNWGLTANIDKTKYLCVGTTPSNLYLGNAEEIHSCEEYKYLGVLFDSTGIDNREIEHRITQGKRAISCLNGIFWSNIAKKCKFNIYEAMVKSVPLYGAETWRLTDRYAKRLEAVEMDALRRSLHIFRMDKVRNDDIKGWMGIEGSISDDISRTQLVWYRHVKRMEDTRLPKQTLEWQPSNRRRRGRPKAAWEPGIRKAMSARDLREGDWTNSLRWNLGIGQRRKTL